MLINELKLAKELIRRPSVTPKDAGSINLLAKNLRSLGFKCQMMNFKNIKNLYAKLGKSSPNFCFAGHTDVVPVGNLKSWSVNPFLGVVKNNKLIVATCNQTTFLQSLAMNIPTVVFWNSEYELLEDSVISDYKKLYDIGILFDSPEAAAKHINELWNNIDIWWNAPELQTIRREFCNKYMYTTNNKDRVLQWSVFFNQLL